ncbi:MAG: Glu-tRNA(Gln) amidotransferase GatDE subunit E, partial [Methanobacteriota archaeon]
MDKYEYANIGLRCGLEIHQQLAGKKLFCNCPAEIVEGPPLLRVRRWLRATASETGGVDQAALVETERRREFIYNCYDRETCLVELDEEPPHPTNLEAVKTALRVALLLGMTPVDEAHCMRKIVVDGSNTSGFQRTILLAIGGSIKTSYGEVSLSTLCLEEESAKIVETGVDRAVYNLSRLGIPLVEIATKPEIWHPLQAEEAALRIGEILRAVPQIRRGLGTIRQDINISIDGGARQEIKGVQEPSLIPKLIDREIQRQKSLIYIKEELSRRGVKPEQFDTVKPVVLTEVFRDTKNSLIRNTIAGGGVVLGLLLPGFGGLLGFEVQPSRRFGSELADHVRVHAGLGGVIHSDELPGYNIGEDELKLVKEKLGAGDGDGFVLVFGEMWRCEKAVEVVAKRCAAAAVGVPSETRQALEDGNTSYQRPLPGAERMYPETDIPPAKISKELLEEVKATLPELPEERMERYVRLGLPRELARKVVCSPRVGVFEEVVRRSGANPVLVATTLFETLTSLRREGVPVEKIGVDDVVEVLKLVAKRDVAKEAVPELLS